MKALYLYLLVAAAACGTTDQPNETITNQAQEQAVSSAKVTDLSEYDVPLQVETPEGEDVTVVWREEFGHLEIRAGKRFGLIITEDVGDLGRKKADLDRDLLQTHTILSEDETSMVYRSEFPDSDKLVFVHLYELLANSDRRFIVSDIQDGKFTESDIAKMKGAVKVQVAG